MNAVNLEINEGWDHVKISFFGYKIYKAVQWQLPRIK